MKLKLIWMTLSFIIALSLSSVSFAAKYWVIMYDDEGFSDRSLEVPFKYSKTTQYQNLRHATASGKKGFNDKATSVKWKLPSGWQCTMYENDSFSKRKFVLRGNGKVQMISHLGWFGDKASSFRCMPRTDPKYD